MIVITGPGRSGTSVLALLYRELGFDPGGVWNEATRSGLEDPAIVRVNDQIAEAIGLTPMGAPGGASRRIRHAGKAFIPARYRSAARRTLRWLPWMESGNPGMLRWDRFDAERRRFEADLRSLARERSVVKDPRFLWTLPMWAAASADITHVVVSTRNLDASIASRHGIDSIRYRSDGAAKNSLIYGLGTTLSALLDYDIPHSFVRFPGFLEDSDGLYGSLPFPAAVTRRDFDHVLTRIRRPDHVHDVR